jgi:hypothetical protein
VGLKFWNIASLTDRVFKCDATLAAFVVEVRKALCGLSGRDAFQTGCLTSPHSAATVLWSVRNVVTDEYPEHRTMTIKFWSCHGSFEQGLWEGNLQISYK